MQIEILGSFKEFHHSLQAGEQVRIQDLVRGGGPTFRDSVSLISDIYIKTKNLQFSLNEK